MNIYIKASQYENEVKYERIQGIIDYVNILLNGLFEPEEIPEQALEVYFLDYYFHQVENGGHNQFFLNASFSRFNAITLQMIIQGLERLQALQYQEIFHSALKLILAEDYNNEARKDDLSVLDDLFFKVKPTLEELNFLKIESMEDLEVVPDEAFEGRMQDLLDSLPNYQERLAAEQQFATDNEPAFSKIVKEICERYGQELLSINALDYGQDIVSEEEVAQNETLDNWYCHITTAQGYHYVINENGNHAILVSGEDQKIIGKMIITDDHLA